MFKKIVISILVVLIAVAGVVYYYFDKITTLPEWYQKTERQINTDKEVFEKNFDKSELAERSARVMKKIQSEGAQLQKIKKEKHVTLNAGEFHDLLIGQMLNASDNDSLIRSVRATHVKINQNSIEAGAVVDLSNLSEKTLSGKEMKWVKTATTVFPFLKDKEVHVAVEGKPVVEKNKLNFDSNSKVKIGEMEMTLSELADKLGTTVEKLKKNTGVDFGRNNLTNINIENSQLEIETQNP